MKKVYIILTYSGTIMSKIIKVSKRSSYAHVSISLDEELNEMYSFGRLNPYNAFLGGFVHESPKFGTFKRFKNTHTLILELTVNKNQYKKMKKTIHTFNNNQFGYKFNILGLFLTAFNIKRTIPDGFYCAEFVKYLLENAKCPYELPNIIVPDDFLCIDDAKIVYQGILQNYHPEKVLS